MSDVVPPLPARLGARTVGWIMVAAAVGVPALVARLAGVHSDSIPEAALFGGGVVGASLLLAWAGEAAEVDIGQGLALAILALIAVLPEYAVDMVLAIKAGGDPARYAPLAAANMTGSNRLLIGVGWSLVALIAIGYIARHRPGHALQLDLDHDRAVEILFLGVATIYSLTIPLRHLFGVENLNLVDTVLLISLFVFYLLRLRGAQAGEAELIGIPSHIACLEKRPRRILIVAMMGYAGLVILASAEPFAEALINVGHSYGISEFFLIQWVAPLASEAPELIIACLFALRGRGEAGMGALLSSKVNQWTLLVGTLPLAYTISAFAHGRAGWALPLDNQQIEEFFLTAAQSLMASAVLADLNMKRWEAIVLFLLFAVQFPFQSTGVRVGMAVIYLVIGAVVLLRAPHRLGRLVRIARGQDPGPSR